MVRLVHDSPEIADLASEVEARLAPVDWELDVPVHVHHDFDALASAKARPDVRLSGAAYSRLDGAMYIN